MNPEKDFEQIKFLLDRVVDQAKIEGTVEHIDVVTAVDRLHKAINRKGFIEERDKP